MLFVRVVRAPDITERAKNGVCMYGTLSWAVTKDFTKIGWKKVPIAGSPVLSFQVDEVDPPP